MLAAAFHPPVAPAQPELGAIGERNDRRRLAVAALLQLLSDPSLGSLATCHSIGSRRSAISIATAMSFRWTSIPTKVLGSRMDRLPSSHAALGL
jgi:hypothetical protein